MIAKRAILMMILLAFGTHAAVGLGSSLTYVVTIHPRDTHVHVAATAQGLRGSSVPLALQSEAAYVEAYITNLRCGSETPSDAGEGRWTAPIRDGVVSYEYDLASIIPWKSSLPWSTERDIAVYVDEECGLFMAPYLFVFPDYEGISSICVRFAVPDDWQVVTPLPFDGEFYVAEKITGSLMHDFLNRQQFYMGPMRFYSESKAQDCVVKFGQLEADENLWDLTSQEEVDAFANATARSVVAWSEIFGANPYSIFSMYTNFRRGGWTFQGTRYLGNGYQYWPEHRWDELTGHLGLAWLRNRDAPLWADVRIEKGIVEDYYGQKLAYDLFADPAYQAKMLLYYYLYEWMSEHTTSATSSYARGIGEFDAYVRWEFIGLLLDEVIQERSGGSFSLDDAMRWLYERYFNTEHVVGISDLERAIPAATGVDVGDVFSRYVYKATKLPVYEYIRGYTDAFQNYPLVCRGVFHNGYYHGHVLPLFIDMVLAASLAPHIPFGLLFGGYAESFAEDILGRRALAEITESDVIETLTELAGQDCSGFFEAWAESYGQLNIEQVQAWLEDYTNRGQDQPRWLGEHTKSPGSASAPGCDGHLGSEWSNPLLTSTDVSGDAPGPAEDIVALSVRTDETYMHVRVDLRGTPQPSIRYSVNLHPVGSSEGYSLHSGGEGMWGPDGFLCQIEYAIGEVVEFAVPLDVVRDLGLSTFYVSADSRDFGAGWIDRYDDIPRKILRLE